MAVGIIHGQESGVQSVNGNNPDINGNVTIDVGVRKVNNVTPDSQGNVNVTTGSIGALPTSGGTMTGPLTMNSSLTIKEPVANNQPVTKGGLDKAVKESWLAIKVTLNQNSWSGNEQSVNATGVTTSNIVIAAPDPADDAMYKAYYESGVRLKSQSNGRVTFRWTETKPGVNLKVNLIIKKVV